MKFPAIALIELNSVAKGILIHDIMLKKATVKVLDSKTTCPGKYIVLIAGEVGDVEESIREARHYAGNALMDSLFIPNIREEIFPAMAGAVENVEIDSVLIVETFSVASAITFADAVLKRNDVRILDLRLAQGLGGKSFFIMTGDLHELEDAKLFVERESEPGMLTNVEIIAAPDEGTVSLVKGSVI